MKKEMIKNIAIIFLAAMLVLTFFSNTIMNRTLPQVSAIYTSQGVISEQIRGSGTVEAAESYEVKTNDSREVKNVLVKVGQEIKAGDPVFEYADGEPKDLTEAEDALYNAEREYRELLLDTSNNPEIDSQINAISRAQTQLEELKEKLSSSKTNTAALDKAAADAKEAKNRTEDLKKEIENLNSQFSAVVAGGDALWELEEKYYDRVNTVNNAVAKAQADADNAKKKFDQLSSQAADTDSYSDQITQLTISIGTKRDELAALYLKYSACDDINEADSLYSQITLIKSEILSLNAQLTSAHEKYSKNSAAVSGIRRAEKALSNAEQKLENAKTSQANELRTIKADIKSRIKTLENKLEKAENELEKAEEAKAEAEKKASPTPEELAASIADKESEIKDLQSKLESSREQLNITNEKNSIAIEAKEREIEKLRAKLEKLQDDPYDTTVTAKVGGMVTAVYITPGETTSAGSTAVAITVIDKGYRISFPVKGEQARKVRIGDKAEITSWYWGSDFSAVLSEIRTDPSSPQGQKILSFTVSGQDITSGQSISLALGSKGQQYNCVIPNNAIREDSNGKFVLAMESKPSPLGNRYKAVRYDIEVLASDDNNSAVNGLTGSEFIITTSTKPISAGEQVRPAE